MLHWIAIVCFLLLNLVILSRVNLIIRNQDFSKPEDKTIEKLIRFRDMGIFTNNELEYKMKQYKEHTNIQVNKNKYEEDLETLFNLKKLNLLSEDSYIEKLDLLNKIYKR